MCCVQLKWPEPGVWVLRIFTKYAKTTLQKNKKQKTVQYRQSYWQQYTVCHMSWSNSGGSFSIELKAQK